MMKFALIAGSVLLAVPALAQAQTAPASSQKAVAAKPAKHAGKPSTTRVKVVNASKTATKKKH